MTKFDTEADLASWLGSHEVEYEPYASKLWSAGAKNVNMLAHASADTLRGLGILPIHADDIKARAATDAAASAAAAAAHLASHGVQAVTAVENISPSDASNLENSEKRGLLQRVLPKASQSPAQMLNAAGLFGCRPVDGCASVCQHLMLLSPELAFVRDASSGALQGVPPAHYVQAWIALQQLSAQFYADEWDRANAVMRWMDKWFQGIRLVVPLQSSDSSSNPAKRHRGNDGEVTVYWGDLASNEEYLVGLFEYKLEMGCGDPQFQLARYNQAFYGNDMRWDAKDSLLIATGVPALGVDIVGPNLMLYGMCVLRTNVLGMEPQSVRLPLVDCGRRWPQLAHQGATLLAAFDVAVYQLIKRYRAAAPDASEVSCPPGHDKHAARIQQVLQSLRHPGVDYTAEFASVQLPHKEVKKLADQRMQQLPNCMCPLPYPLWGSCASLKDVQPLQLPGMPDKAVYQAQGQDGRPVFIKFTAGDYPDWVHQALADASLAPALIECKVLPGGGCMVVMEMLQATEGWVNAAVQQQRVHLDDSTQTMLLDVLQKAHSLEVPAPALASSGSDGSSSTWTANRLLTRRGSGKVVLGDARPANIMIKVCTAGTSLQVTEARFVDLDWAGMEGTARYPAVPLGQPSSIPWHGDVKPGAFIKQEHDTHLLRSSLRAA